MRVSQNLTYPDEIGAPSTKRLTVFKERVWHNSEVCNNCFQQIRTIGPEVTRELKESRQRPLSAGPPEKVTTYEWYERTDHGSQEHTVWDKNKRFGTCFCARCGADGGATNDTLSVADLKSAGKRIVAFLNTQTPYNADPVAFGRVLGKLCAVDDNSGYDTEKLAAAAAHSLDSPVPSSDKSSAVSD